MNPYIDKVLAEFDKKFLFGESSRGDVFVLTVIKDYLKESLETAYEIGKVDGMSEAAAILRKEFNI